MVDNGDMGWPGLRGIILTGMALTALSASLHGDSCASGVTPGRAPIRRLNRNEYTATVRQLLNVHLDVGHDLPADGAGGQGFDNAAETLFLSPIHAEKYMDAAKR